MPFSSFPCIEIYNLDDYLKRVIPKVIEASSNRRSLIILDHKEYDILNYINDLILKCSNDVVPNIIIITNRDTADLRKKLQSVEKFTVSSDSAELKLTDLETSEDIDSYEIVFQEIKMKLKELPSYKKLKDEISGACLEKFIKNKTFNFGTELPDIRNVYYEPRKLAPINFDCSNPNTDYKNYESLSKCEYFINCYENVSSNEIDEIDEENFVEDVQTRFHINIIGGETGAGKSTTLRHLANRHKKKYPSTWVIFVDFRILNKQIKEEINKEWIEHFLLSKALCSTDPKCARQYFLNLPRDKIVLYIDSFDEACNNFTKNAIKIIERLKCLHRIVISTRQYHEPMLCVQQSDCKMYRLISLNFDNQLNILKRLLEDKGLSLPHNSEQVLRSLKLQLSIDSKVKLGETLAVNMLAQIFTYNSETKIESMFDLFVKYIDCYVHIFLQKKLNMSIDGYRYEEYMEFTRNRFYEGLGMLSLKKKMNPEALLSVLAEELIKKINEVDDKPGMIIGLTSPNLGHQSFVDFFFAHSVHSQYKKISNSATFLSVFETYFRIGFEREFFFCFLSKDFEKQVEIKTTDRQLFNELRDSINPGLSQSELELPGIRRLLMD